MKSRLSEFVARSAICAASALLLLFPVLSLSQDPEPTPFENRDDAVDRVIKPDTPDQDPVVGARESVNAAAEVLRQMEDESDLRQLLDEARGVFVIPDYATAALIIGAAGGEGVLFTRRNEQWGNPALYDVGSLSAGIQAGVAAGSIAMVLMSEPALEAFTEQTNISLSAEAGFTITDWSARALGELDEGNDVVVWTDTAGLFAHASVGLNNIAWDHEKNETYYGYAVTPRAVLSGEAENPHRQSMQESLQSQ